ncbi:MAG: magnesium transporter [Candidatus Muiribacteriota bacterium]
MEEKNLLLIPELKELIKEENYKALKDFCEESHPVDIAEILQYFTPVESWYILRILDHEIQGEIFSNIEPDFQVEITSLLNKKELTSLITHMSHDDRVDLLKIIPEKQKELVLSAIAKAEREDIKRLLSYEEGTAGSIMTSEYVILSKELTVTQAIEEVRKQAPDKETIYYTYIVDKNRKLIGFVSLADLITELSGKKLYEIMNEDIIFVNSDEDQEIVSNKISKYDLIAIPVVNKNKQLVGIVTYDDAIDVINQEHTEDMEKFMAITGEHEGSNYLKTSVWKHFKNRIGWVIGLAFIGLLAGSVIAAFEESLEVLVVLAFFMPMIADTGGNVGSQAATVVIRALALKELSITDFPKIIFKEFGISLMLSVLIGVVTFINAIIIMRGASIPDEFQVITIALTIALALSMQVISSTLIGAFLPMAAAKMNLDPAVAASPAITTTVDITGLIIYFTLARIILNL